VTIIGDATVRVRIDTSGAEAQLDRQDRKDEREKEREERRRRREREKKRREDTSAKGRRKILPRIPTARGVLASIPFAGAAILAAEYGPAIAQMVDVVTDRVLQDVPGIARDVVKTVTKGMLEAINAAAEQIAEIEATLFAAFGGVSDTAELAKVAFLWKMDGAKVSELKDFLEYRFEARKNEGLGRFAERQVRRKAIGEGLGNALADFVKTQE